VFLEYDPGHNSWVLRGGIEVELIQLMSKYFNFTYQIINCFAERGIELHNKTWTGIIGKVNSSVCLKIIYSLNKH